MNGNKSIRVLMFPWLGYGHITPYFELAHKLSSRNFIIYLCSTQATLNCIKIPQKLSNTIIPVPLSLPTLPGLPPQLQTTNGLPSHLMPKLKEAFDLSAPAFADILSNLDPDLLIYDFLQPWAPAAAKERNIPAIEFITSSSTMTCYMFHHLNKSGIDFPFSQIYFRDFELSIKTMLFRCVSHPEEDRATEAANMSHDIVLIKGFREIEGKYIDYVTSLVGKKFVPVGPLVQEPSPDHDGADNKYSDVMSWLDEKEIKSTIFVSFGSECVLNKEDVHEIANGLELSNVNFIWVLRFPIHELPLGFVDRVGNRGKIVEGWAPQKKILGHANVGGFVSHCGWNSVMEGMSFGVPIIGVPMDLDQPINARLVEEVGVGLEVVKDKNGRIRRDEVASVIKKVVVEDSGRFVRQKARDMREKLREKGDEEIDQVVEELVKICNKNRRNKDVVCSC